MIRAQVIPVQRSDLIEGEAALAFELLVEGRDVADVVARIGPQGALEAVEAQPHRVGGPLLDPGDLFPLEDFELALGERRLAEDLAEDLQHGEEVGALGLQREGQAAGARAAAEPLIIRPPGPAAEPGEILVERVLDLLAGHRLRAPRHQLGQRLAGLVKPLRFSALP